MTQSETFTGSELETRIMLDGNVEWGCVDRGEQSSQEALCVK